MQNKNIVNIKDLTKTYEIKIKANIFGQERKDYVKAVDGITAQMEEGDFLGLVGPNGSGKTTLMKILAGVLIPDKGQVDVLGFVPWQRKEEYLKKISVMFGNRSGLLFDLPVIDSFELNKVIYEIDNNKYKRRLEKISKILGLKEIINIPVRKLSFGQRIRAEIGLAFLHEPKFVILDEPTIGLDIIVKNKIYEFLSKINVEENVTIMFSTHIIGDIERLCNKMMILNKGKVIWKGSMNELPSIFSKTKEIVFEYENAKSNFDRFVDKHRASVQGNKISFLVDAKKEKIVIKEIEKIFKIKTLEIKQPSLEALLGLVYSGEKHFDLFNEK
ncbi:MAG: ATP-binding cassette domain-containing protein [Candidatus Anstonellales archaeon]